MPTIGPLELIVVMIIALVILGPKRLPAAGKSLGDGMRQFRDSISGNDDAAAAVAAPVALAVEDREPGGTR